MIDQSHMDDIKRFLVSLDVRTSQIVELDETDNSTLEEKMEVVEKYNPYHRPAGSYDGGQFDFVPGHPRSRQIPTDASSYAAYNARSLEEKRAAFDNQPTYEKYSHELGALSDYVGADYRPMNNMLRKEVEDTDVASEVATLRQMIDKAEITEDIVVWRGMNLAHYGVNPGDQLHPTTLDQRLDQARQNFDGTTLSDKAFLSTSVDIGVADRFIMGRAHQSDKVAAVMEIRVPAGSRGLYVDRLRDKNWEDEVILPPGSRLRVVEISTLDIVTHPKYSWEKPFRGTVPRIIVELES